MDYFLYKELKLTIMRSKRQFTEEEKETILSMRSQGSNINEIASRLHCGDQVISKFLKAQGMPMMQAGPKKPSFEPGGIVNEKPSKATGGEYVTDLVNTWRPDFADMTSQPEKINESLKAEIWSIINSDLDLFQAVPSADDILVNEDLEDLDGCRMKFDIIIPELRSIIVNTKSVEEWKEWFTKVEHGPSFAYFLASCGDARIYYITGSIDNDGFRDPLQTIMANMKKRLLNNFEKPW